MGLTAAQKLIERRVLELDAKIAKMQDRCERSVPKARETAADRAEKMTRARWADKLAPLIAEADALRESLPKE